MLFHLKLPIHLRKTLTQDFKMQLCLANTIMEYGRALQFIILSIALAIFGTVQTSKWIVCGISIHTVNCTKQ